MHIILIPNKIDNFAFCMDKNFFYILINIAFTIYFY